MEVEHRPRLSVREIANGAIALDVVLPRGYHWAVGCRLAGGASCSGCPALASGTALALLTLLAALGHITCQLLRVETLGDLRDLLIDRRLLLDQPFEIGDVLFQGIDLRVAARQFGGAKVGHRVAQRSDPP